MKMISDLPRDIVEEILSRLPLKSMKAVRLTCKTWNTLSKNRSFSKMQIDKEEAATKEGEYKMIVMMNKKLCLMSFINNGDPYVELKGKFTCLTEQLKLKKNLFNSEGLLFCTLRDDKNNTKLMVWNPYCMQPKWIEPRCSYNQLKGRYNCCYGLGYVEKRKNTSSCRSHKILRFIDINFAHNVIPERERFSWYEIYDLDSDSWRTLDITPLSISFEDYGITVKGNTYWCVTERGFFHIICFDFTKERFGPLMHLPYNVDVDHVVVLSCVKEEKLAALLGHFPPNQPEIEIWITTEIDPEKLTWSKFFTVNMGDEILNNLESFIIDEEKKLVIGIGTAFDYKIVIIGECGYFKEIDLSADYYRRYLCAYVPSLVHIRQAAENESRKEDNSENSEKLRYDEKMSTLAAYEKRIKKIYNELPRGTKCRLIRKTNIRSNKI